MQDFRAKIMILIEFLAGTNFCSLACVAARTNDRHRALQSMMLEVDVLETTETPAQVTQHPPPAPGTGTNDFPAIFCAKTVGREPDRQTCVTTTWSTLPIAGTRERGGEN